MGDPSLVVRFLEDERLLGAGEQVTFGRAADVVLDDENLYLHRVVGRFVWWDGLWWVENLSEAIELQLLGDDGSQVRLPPETKAPLTQKTAVRFSAGGLPYEVEAALPGQAMPVPRPLAPVAAESTTTCGDIVLTDEERALVLELARPFLRDPSASQERLPANADVAATLDWSVPKLNRKLDYLCLRLTKAGVNGLQGGRKKATNRRWVLVQHALRSKLVTPNDLLR